MDIETKSHLINRGLDFLNQEGRLPDKFVLVNLEPDTYNIWMNLDPANRRRIETTIETPCVEDVNGSTESQQDLLSTFISRVKELQPNFVVTTDFGSLPNWNSRELFRQRVATHLPHNTNMIVVGEPAIPTGRNLWHDGLPVRAIYTPEVPQANQVTIIPRQSIYAADPYRLVSAVSNFNKSI